MKHMTAVPQLEILKFLDLLKAEEKRALAEQKTLQERISVLDALLQTIVVGMREYMMHDARLIPTTNTKFTAAMELPRWGILGWFGLTKHVPAKTTTQRIPVTCARVSRDVRLQLDRLLTLARYDAGNVHVTAETVHWSRPRCYQPRVGRPTLVSLNEFIGEYSITAKFTRSEEHERLESKADMLTTRLREVRTLQTQLELGAIAGGDIYMPVEDYARLKALK